MVLYHYSTLPQMMLAFICIQNTKLCGVVGRDTCFKTRSEEQHRDLLAERSGGSLVDLSGTRSELRLRVEVGLEVELTHLGRSVLP